MGQTSSASERAPDAVPPTVGGALRLYVKERRGVMTLYFVLVGLSLLLVTAVPMAIARLVQQIKGESSKAIAVAVFAVAVLWLLKELIMVALKAMDQVLVTHLRRYLTRWVTESFLLRPPSDSEGQDSRASAIENAARLPHVIVNVVQQARQDVLPLLIRGLGVVVGFWLLGWRFGVPSSIHFLVSIGLLFLGVFLGVRRRVSGDARSTRQQAAIADVLQNARAINSAGTAQEEQRRLKEIGRAEMRDVRRLSRESSALWNVVAVLNAGFVVGGLIWLMRRITMDGLSGASAGAVAMIFYQSGSIDIALSEYELLIEHTAATHEADRFVRSLPRETFSTPSMSEAVERVAATAQRGVPVKLDNVGFRYPGSLYNTHHDLSLTFDAGRAYVLRAPSGAGKSTLLRLVQGELAPSTGRVNVAGLEPSVLSPRDRARLMEYVPQIPTLFNRSVLENIMYSRDALREDASRPQRREAVQALLRELKLDRDPAFALDRNVGANGALLSGGQRRMVCLMRAYFRSKENRVPLLLLDEPLVNLGAEMREAALVLLARLTPGRTVIAVSHDPNFPSSFKAVRV